MVGRNNGVAGNATLNLLLLLLLLTITCTGLRVVVILKGAFGVCGLTEKASVTLKNSVASSNSKRRAIDFMVR